MRIDKLKGIIAIQSGSLCDGAKIIHFSLMGRVPYVAGFQGIKKSC
jgi:hypothetical protein